MLFRRNEMGRLDRLEEDEVLTVRTYKVVPNAEIAWANTYEVIVDQPTVDPDVTTARLSALRNAFVTLERGLLNAAYILDRIIISTYVPDGTPYDPFTFVSYTISQPGTYFTPGNPLLPLQFCALVKRTVNYGRQGSILYRGAVAANDAIITPGGTVIETSRRNVMTGLLNSFISSVQQAGFDLVMARGRETVEIGTLRRVVGIEVKDKMTFKKLNNRYFDKARIQN
jgi:hypothetical protein